MTKVTVSAVVKAKAGPSLAISTELDPETVVQAAVELDEAGGTAPSKTIELLAAGGKATVLALSAQGADGKPAAVTVVPRNGGDTGDPIAVTGALLVANESVLAALVTGGPRAITLTNAGTQKVTVDVIAARAD
jgi:hypothetical protein